MNKIALSLAIASLLILGTARPVLAAGGESDPAAQLSAFHSVSADRRVPLLKAYLHSHGSPLESDAKTFVAEADRNNLDWRLVAAIAGTESTFGKQIPGGSYNAWGWGIFTGANDGVHFANWAQGIATVSEGLRKNYYDKGAKDIYDVGWKYAANGNSWGSHVQFFINEMNSFAPVDSSYLDLNI